MLFNNTYIILSTISKVFFQYITNSGYYLGKFFKLLNYHLKNDGTLNTVILFKAYRLHYTKYLCNQPLRKPIGGLKYKVNKAGLPVELDFLEELLQSPKMIRFLLTILSLTRVIKPKKKEKFPTSYKTITDPFKGKYKKLDQTTLIRVMKDMGLKKQKVPGFSFENIFPIISGGPMGSSSLMSWETMKKYTYDDIRILCGMISARGCQ